LQYPLAKAQSFRAAPEHAALVNALDALLTPLDLALPIALAFLADRAGLRVTLLVLAVQPVTLFVLAAFVRPTPTPAVPAPDRRARFDG
jgi:hypothetical protein